MYKTWHRYGARLQRVTAANIKRRFQSHHKINCKASLSPGIIAEMVTNQRLWLSFLRKHFGPARVLEF